MAYDEDLANRLRELLADEDAVTEKKMFGGLAFLLDGKMCVSASRNGGLLARIDPADTDAALARPHVALMQMGGRTMDGWITVAPEALKTKRQLGAWVERSVGFVKTLPPKEPRPGR
jgi:TfoX/Sxy family transcriptional regulator of competence genes